MDTRGSKRRLRTEARARLAAMDPDDAIARSAAIVEHLRHDPAFLAARTVLLFLPLTGDGVDPEPDLRPLLDDPGAVSDTDLRRRMFVPRVDWTTRAMDAVETVGGAFGFGRYGVPTPTGESVLAPSALDLIFVPGLAFTATGDRLGRGGGFYDRYLARVDRTWTRLVGIGFATQVVDALPREPHDARMDAVVTENGHLAVG